MKREGWDVAVCVASGPSLTQEQVEIITQAQREGRCRVLVTNLTYQRFPAADALYAADGRFLKVHLDDIRANFRGEVWTQDHVAAQELGVHWIHGKPGAGLSGKPDMIYHGGNSGHQQIGLAYLFGARRILLVAYDMSVSPDGRKHHHPDHRKPLSNGDMRVLVPHYEKMARDLEAAGVECVNCTGPNSAIPYFRRGELADELALVPA